VDSAHAEKVRFTIDNDTQEISIGISEDGIKAFLSINPSISARSFDPREIFEMIEDERIIVGVKRRQIQKAIDEVNRTLRPIRDVVIAIGTPILKGQEPYIQYHFRTDRQVSFSEDETGKVDFKDLGNISNVNQGDLLAERIEGTPAISGTDVYGKTLEPEPLPDVSLQPGAHVTLSEDEQRCYAAEDGQAYLKNHKVTVSAIHEVAGDVDLNVGNIDFNGSIKVSGSVLGGFVLKAKGNITIAGLVEGATLEAGGSIVIKGGIKGAERGKITCGGDLITTFIESGDVLCRGNMFIESSIVNSKIECHRQIKAVQGKGSIVAGELFATGGIECLELGSKIGVSTTVTVGDKPIVRKRLEELAAKMEPFQNEHKVILKAVDQYQALFERIDTLEPEKKESLLAIMKKKKDLESKLREMEEVKTRLLALFNAHTISRVKVHRTTHPNTTLNIGHVSMSVKIEYKNSCFSENPTTKGVGITPVR
jgi:uncharacterized protein